MNGEQRAGGHTLAFTRELEALIEHFRRRGQLTGFAVQRRGSLLEPHAAHLHARLLTKLQRTILAGPVTYAGGSRKQPLFAHARGDVLVAAPLWRELSLMGHWIQEALVLRWAELVHALSAHDVPLERVVERLLVRPDLEREQGDAREAYKAARGLSCVWTGKPLTAARFEVDHVLPYSLWRNNDLWNLLPAHPQVNREKRDLIPTTELLRRRESAIVECWEITRARMPVRFANEARAQVGGVGSGAEVELGRLFERLVESAEVTAVQRACPRWQPGS